LGTRVRIKQTSNPAKWRQGRTKQNGGSFKGDSLASKALRAFVAHIASAFYPTAHIGPSAPVRGEEMRRDYCVGSEVETEGEPNTSSIRLVAAGQRRGESHYLLGKKVERSREKNERRNLVDRKWLSRTVLIEGG